MGLWSSHKLVSCVLGLSGDILVGMICACFGLPWTHLGYVLGPEQSNRGQVELIQSMLFTASTYFNTHTKVLQVSTKS